MIPKKWREAIAAIGLTDERREADEVAMACQHSIGMSMTPSHLLEDKDWIEDQPACGHALEF